MTGSAADYGRVREIVGLLRQSRGRVRGADGVAAQAGLSPAELDDLLRRWCGLTLPDLAAAIFRARGTTPLEEAAARTAGRMAGPDDAAPAFDLFVSDVTPAPDGSKRGRGRLLFGYGFHPSPFGEVLLVLSERGLAGLGFADEGDRGAALDDMRRRWPGTAFEPRQGETAAFATRIFDPGRWRPSEPLPLDLIGTGFETAVWRALLRIPVSRATTYSAVASELGRPTAARATGAAIGKNPVSFVVPCHRVIGQSGDLTGYYWGLDRKGAMLAWEAGLRAGRPRVTPG